MIAMITPPKKLIALSGMFKAHFALAQCVLGDKDGEYVHTLKYFARRGDLIVMDNGVTELGEALPLEEVIEAAQLVGAREIVLPDVFNDAEGSKELLRQNYGKVSHVLPEGIESLMYVAHGNNVAEILTDIIWVARSFPFIRTIGIPKVLTENLRDHDPYLLPGRPGVLEGITEVPHLQQKVDFHLLGVWEDLTEVRALAGAYGSWIRSIDTSLPVMAGLRRVLIGEHPTAKYPLETDIANDVEMNTTMLTNMMTYRRWVEDHPSNHPDGYEGLRDLLRS